MRIAVIGGGVSGLSAAYWLLRTGGDDIRVDLFEKRPSTGGLCQTVELDGFLFDFGPHNIHSVDESFNEFLSDLMGDELRARIYKPRVVFRDKFIPYPMKGLDILKGVPPWTSAACAASFLAGRVESLFKEWKDDSFEDFITNRFGRKLYDIYFGPFTEKTWGVPGSLISADFGRQRIGVFTLWDLFKRTFLGMKPKALEAEEDPFLNSRCFYPDRGSGSIIDTLVEYCIADPRFVLHAAEPVEGITPAQGGYGVRTGASAIDVDFVLSSISLEDLCRMLGLPDPGLVYISTRFLLVTLDQESVFGATPWVYFADDRTAFNRVSEPRNMSPMMSPEGRTSLCFEFTTTGSDEISAAEDGELLDLAVSGLSRYGLLRPGAVRDWKVVDWENTYPLRTLDYREATMKALLSLEPFGNLFTHGRLGRFEYFNMDHCMTESRILASSITGRKPEDADR
jgi:protoporphyrinogen oxidase